MKVDLEKDACLYMRMKERKKKKVRLAQPLGSPCADLEMYEHLQANVKMMFETPIFRALP